MSGDSLLMIVTAVFALCAALLTWLAIDIGINTMARYRSSFTERAKFQTKEFFLFIDPKKLFAAHLALMGLSGAATWMITGSAIVTIPVFALLAFMPRAIYAWLRTRRLRRFDEQLPDALMMLAGGMRAGVGLTSGLQQVISEAPAPLSQEFSLVLREQRLGVTLDQSLNNLVRRVPTQAATLVVSAMRIASNTGGGLAETLERTAHTIRARLQMEGKIDALTAQGKLQAWVSGLLPVAMMGVLDKMEPEAMSQLWNTRPGWGVLVVIVFMEIMGVYLIRRIVAIDV